MNRFVVVVVTGALAFGGCQKQQSEAERNAEVEREVQARLTAEHQTAEQQRLAERQAELEAHEKALADKERAPDTNARERVEPSSGQAYPAAPRGGESYSVFYTRLEPFGAWIETPTYGYVWQPRNAMESRSWRPYTDGHWVYTDAGWTWISEEPFGWATYHYGRWTRLRGIGWVWVPGDEWAPAWVSWRVSNDYVGWAPLPPEAQFEARVGIRNWADNYYDIGPEQYCFVPTREIGAERIERVVVSPEQNVTIVNQTTNVTNITYNNTVVVNQGPNYDELRARSQQPIPRLRLERRTTIAAENLRAVVKGEVVEVPAPVIARAQPVERPPIVKQKVSESVVEHGWEQVAGQPGAQQARAKMKAEATPPPNAPPKTFVKPAPVAGQPRTASPAPREAGNHSCAGVNGVNTSHTSRGSSSANSCTGGCRIATRYGSAPPTCNRNSADNADTKGNGYAVAPCDAERYSATDARAARSDTINVAVDQSDGRATGWIWTRSKTRTAPD